MTFAPSEWIWHPDIDIPDWGDLVSGSEDADGNLVDTEGNVIAWATAEAAEAAMSGSRDMAMRDVTPHAKRKLKGILDHYREMPHPFASCVRDNRKRFGPGTEAVCAVVKDLAYGTTDWRKKGWEKKNKGKKFEGVEFGDYEDEELDAWLGEHPDVVRALGSQPGAEYGDLTLTPEQEELVQREYEGDVALWLAAEFADWASDPVPEPVKRQPTSERTRSIPKAEREAQLARRRGDAKRTAFWESRVRELTVKQKEAEKRARAEAAAKT